MKRSIGDRAPLRVAANLEGHPYPLLSSPSLPPYTDGEGVVPSPSGFLLSLLPPTRVNLQQLQDIIRTTYDAKDRRRGVEGTFMWFMEEVGELAAALRGGSADERAAEFADVLAWLATLANIAEVDLAAAVQAKYGAGCPGCRHSPCVCDRTEKP